MDVWLSSAFLLLSTLTADLAFGFICGFNDARVSDLSESFFTMPEDSGWSLLLNTSWPVPDVGHDGYYVVIQLQNSVSDEYSCTKRTGYSYTSHPWYTFRNLKFGHKYEVKIRLYNATTGRSSLSPSKFQVSTPDCLDETGSIEFCSTQDIPVASKVRDVIIESVQLNEHGNGTDVTVSWLPPVQINGALRYIALSYRPKSQIPYDGIERFYPEEIEWDGRLDQRFVSVLPSLQEDIIYALNLKPYVQINDMTFVKAGHDLEVTFNTSVTLSTTTSTVRDSSNSTDATSVPPIDGSTVIGGDVELLFDYVKDQWQWMTAIAVVLVLLLTALLALVMVMKKRKTQRQQQQNAVLS